MCPHRDSHQLYLTLNILSEFHKFGPYGNLKDVHVLDYIGALLFSLCSSPSLCGEARSIDMHSQVSHINTPKKTHQESRSPMLAVKKVTFNRSVGFVCSDTSCDDIPTSKTVDMCRGPLWQSGNTLASHL